MKFDARLSGVDQLFRNLQKASETIAPAALDAAADALALIVEHSRESEGLRDPLIREGTARRRAIGASDPDSVARELGTINQNPAPWLASSLPAARGPMRAAVLTAVARAISSLRLSSR